MGNLVLPLLLKILDIGSVSVMAVCCIRHRTLVNPERKFDVFCFICEHSCSHVYVLPHTLVKFHANLRNSEIRDTG